MRKLKIGVFFGGRSGEHAVSLRSAASIMEVMDRDRYTVIPIGITKEGEWLAGGDPMRALMEQTEEECTDAGGIENKEEDGTREGSTLRESSLATVVINPRRPGIMLYNSLDRAKVSFQDLDLAFPVLHGPFGEDGTIQGLLEIAGIPYIGSGVLGSAVGMDKVIMKQLFKQSGIPVAEFIFLRQHQWGESPCEAEKEIEEKLGYPCFVKPANLGSSVGISKAKNKVQLTAAIKEAFRYDLKVIVEKFMPGKEIECSVLGNSVPCASVPGEIVPSGEFYDYHAKYVDERSELIIPAPLSEETTARVRALAVDAFCVIDAEGLARVDFFVNEGTEEVTVNEINTIPGFTSISMYPKLWEASGLSYGKLIDRLIELALERHLRRKKLLFSPFSEVQLKSDCIE